MHLIPNQSVLIINIIDYISIYTVSASIIALPNEKK